MAPKDLKDYLDLDYTLILKKDEEGDWVATVKELEGCIADGSSPEEAVKHLESMKELWLRARIKSNRPVPLPDKEQEDFSGKFLQRIPKSLHRKVVKAAERDGVSLNQFVTAVLAEAVGYKAAKDEPLALSIEAVADRGRWFLEPDWKQSRWETIGSSARGNPWRDDFIRILTDKTPFTDEKPIEREPNSANEESHEIWNSWVPEVAGR